MSHVLFKHLFPITNKVRREAVSDSDFSIELFCRIDIQMKDAPNKLSKEE